MSTSNTYSVVEFADDDGGGVSLIRCDWLTPKKQRCLWPPKNLMSKFHKCLDGSIVADSDKWESCYIKRVFYETDSLSKAREKQRQAETESEINSDHEISTRRRKKTRKIYDSDTSCSGDGNLSDDNPIVYPTPPALNFSTGDGKETNFNSASGNKDLFRQKDPKKASSAGIRSRDVTTSSTSPEFIKSLESASKIHHHRLKQFTDLHRHTKGTDDEKETHKASNITGSHSASANNDCMLQKHPKRASEDETTSSTNSEVISLESPSCLDLTVTADSKDTTNSQALDYIAKHLARIESEIRDLQIHQQEILMRVRSSTLTPLDHSLPPDATLPCDTNDALIKIETWIGNKPENGKLLTTHLSLVGGNKIPTIIRRILEKLFTNKLAALCNWTGKNTKIPLKDLQLIKILRDAVRANQIAANATDSEIHEVISNWFRFTKDRNGGREARRANKE